MTDLFQWQIALNMFHDRGNVLHTIDFLTNIHTASQYRRILSKDLPDKGYKIEARKITPQDWEYRLIESQPNLLEVA